MMPHRSPRALVPALLAALPAQAGVPWPAADCAALWLGYGDYAGISAFLDGRQEAHDTAARFRAAALRQAGGDAAVDAHIARVRPDMARMIAAHVEIGDRQSRDLFERFSQTCEELAASLPEFEDMQ